MDIVRSLIPTFFFIILGYALKRGKVFEPDFARSLLKLVVYVGLPALSLRSITQLKLDFSAVSILLLSIALTSFSYLLIKTFEKTAKLPPKRFAVFLMATMIVNSAFTQPFLQSLTGDAGAARVALFNLTHHLILFAWIYSIAVSYSGGKKLTGQKLAVKVFSSPPLIVTLLGLTMNIFRLHLPNYLVPTVSFLADLTNPLFLIAFGIILEPKMTFPWHILTSVTVRMVGGLLIGMIFVSAFALTGINRTATLLLSASPVGLMAVTFSSMEKLDDEFAASIVSTGMLVGLVLLSILTYYLS